MQKTPRRFRPSSTRRLFAEALEARRMLAADLVISEFLASNDDSITDSFTNHEDWIEIYNAGDAPANLNDYFLTDNPGNPEKWRFPVQNLAAGSSLIVWASERNLAAAGQELHTNFKLDGAGEYLALIRAADDSVQFEYAPTYPAQSSDISYGLTDSTNPNSARIYFSVPTPGALNAPSVTAPTFSVGGKTFNGSMQVTLSTSTPGATIRYTTNNSAPTAASTLYAGPINLTASTIVRAKAFASGYVDSPVSSESYTAVDSTVNTFRSNLPIVVLELFNPDLDGIPDPMNDQTYLNVSATFINTGVDGYADMLDPVDFAGRVGLRYRGSTSFSNYPKKPYALEVRDENNGDRNASILGMPADSDWVLYSPWTERSLMNNALAMDWSQQMGHYASRIRFVEVYLNNNADTAVNYTSDYRGVYILMEKPKLDDHRVDVTQVLPTATTEPDISGGYFFKKDRKETQEIQISTTGGAFVGNQPFVMIAPDETEITQAQITYLTNYLQETDNVMNGANFADPVNGYAKYIDVDSWVDFWIMAEFTKSVDSFWLSTFYYKPQGGKIFMGPNWDFNLAFGQANYRDGASVSGYNNTSLTTGGSFGDQYGWFRRLWQDPVFKLKVTDRWQELRNTVLNTNKMFTEMDAYVALLTDNNGQYPVGPGAPTQPSTNAAIRNFKKWPVLGTYSTTNSYFDSQGRWIEDINLMKQWIKGRAEWFDTQFVPPPVLSPSGGTFGSPTNVTMTPKAQATGTDTSLLATGPVTNSVTYLVPSSTLSGWQNLGYSTAGWTTSSFLTGKGLGYDTTTTPVNYASLIGVNVQTPMLNIRSSIYMRISFNIANPANVDHLILKMKYDDGFYAWVNGVRVIEGGVGENSVPAFSSTTAADRDETLATQYVEWDISEIKSQLVAGTNILAIQGVNRSSSSNDFLAVPELFSRTYSNGTPAAQVYYNTNGSDPRDPATGNPSATAVLYSGAISVNASRRLRARTLNAGIWSGIADEVYNFDANDLRVTEIMYNPPAPPTGPFTAQDFEFIEVKNIGATTLNLAGYNFADGITFAFPNTTLAAGAYGVIVKNQAAFESRYGTGRNILGVFGGTSNLDNGGETITIQNGFAQTMQTFTYDDAWYPSTDGGGYSMVVVSATQAMTNWDIPAGWRASSVVQGQPGLSDPDVTPPTLVSGAFTAATNSVTLTFSEPVTFTSPLSNVSITKLAAGGSVTPSGFSTTYNSVTFTLSSPVDEIYRLSLNAPSVKDTSNLALTSNAVFTFLYVAATRSLALPMTAATWSIDQLVLGTGAKLDLANDSLVLRNGDHGAWNGSAYTGVSGAIASAFNGGAWNGPGIGTSATAGGGAVGGVGAAQASEVLSIANAATAQWEGQTVSGTSVLIKFTYLGDANLDGQINADDYAWIDLYSPSPGSSSYAHGDFNFSGAINADDYAYIDFNATEQGPPL
jgi:hypothetical protein